MSISSKQFKGIESEKLKKALVHTEEVNRLVKEYRHALSVPWPKSPPNAQEIVKEKFKERDRRERGASILRRIAVSERKAVDEIQRMIA